MPGQGKEEEQEKGQNIQQGSNIGISTGCTENMNWDAIH